MNQNFARFGTLKRSSTALAVLAAGLSAMPVLAQDSVVVIVDYTKTHPTLSKLCVAQAQRGVDHLSFGTVVTGPTEIVELIFDCGVSGLESGKPHTAFGLQVRRTAINRADMIQTTEAVESADLQINQVQGVTEFVLTLQSDSSTSVARYFLALNAQGQPVNSKGQYHGTHDPEQLSGGDDSKLGQYISGLHQVQSVESSYRSCVALADQPVQDCKWGEQRTLTKAVGATFATTLTLTFGWLPGNAPNNRDLNAKHLRVDFQKSLSELKSFIDQRYGRVQDSAQLIEDAKKALADLN
jgi:hypothetical protein